MIQALHLLILHLKYIMSGGTSGYINGLVIKNVYYIDEELANNTPAPKPTVDPSIQGIDISGTSPLYGNGSVAVNDDGSVTGTSVDGLLPFLSEQQLHRENLLILQYTVKQQQVHVCGYQIQLIRDGLLYRALWNLVRHIHLRLLMKKAEHRPGRPFPVLKVLLMV